MKKTLQKVSLIFLFLLAACSAGKDMKTDWFTLHVPNGIAFTESDPAAAVHELKTETVRYLAMDQDNAVMIWFVKASPSEIEEVYDMFAVVMNKMKLELSEKKETDPSMVYVYTPVMANGKPLVEQYQLYAVCRDKEESWLVSLTAPYSRIGDKDKFIKMLSTIEFAG